MEEGEEVLLTSHRCQSLLGCKSTSERVRAGRGSKKGDAIAEVGIRRVVEDGCVKEATGGACSDPVGGGGGVAESGAIGAGVALEASVDDEVLAGVASGVGHLEVVLAIVDCCRLVCNEVVLYRLDVMRSPMIQNIEATYETAGVRGRHTFHNCSPDIEVSTCAAHGVRSTSVT
jgi:hypothetical protein